MNNSNIAIKSLVIYALVVPLAILLGFLLGNPLSYSSLGTIGMVSLLLIFPLLMKWHYPLMLLSWNMSLSGLFFLPGSPSLWLVLVALSFGMAALERALARKTHFILVPQTFWPLLVLALVVLVTAKMTGGFGLRSMGSDVYGGKKYIYLLAAIASYFVLTSRAIPVERAHLYVGLFFIGGATSFIGDLFPITPKALHFIFWVFPPYSSTDLFEVGLTRLRGTGAAAFAVYCWMMARYGLRGIFLSGKFWRLALFLLVVPASLLGGFRSTMLAIVMIFALQFYLEGLHRTKLLPAFALLGVVGAVLVVPLAPHLPFTFQRALAFLPLDIDPKARLDAEDSSQWRIDLWESVLPEVPKHLLLGKGYAVTQADYQMMGRDVSFKAFDPSQQGLALSFDYHNGPLSTIIPFGIWGLLAFCWFIAASLWALWRNYRFGDSELRLINTGLFAIFVERAFMFTFVTGALNSDLVGFIGLIGLSIALNRGVSKRVVEPVVVEEQAGGVALPLHRRPSFQR